MLFKRQQFEPGPRIGRHQTHTTRRPAARTVCDKAGQRGGDVPGALELGGGLALGAHAAGGIDEEVTDRVNPENLRIALEATKLFRLEVAGVDIISPDIAKPWYENNAIINEFNFAPLLGEG